MEEDLFFKERQRPYHPDIERGINLVTMKNETKPVGSYRWYTFKYPSDIDILEDVVEIAPDLKTACHIFAQRIRTMAIRIYVSSPRAYLADFKAGCDTRLKPIWFIVKKKNVRYGRTDRRLSKDLIEIVTPSLETAVEEKAITKEEMKAWLKLSAPELYDAVREKYIIRWNIFELIKDPPRKTLPGGKLITLQDALMVEQRVAKMDIWAPVREGFQEIENVLSLSFKKDNDAEPQRVTRLFWKSYASTICHEIRKMLRTGKSLKIVKRMWFLSRCLLTSKNHNYSSALLKEARNNIRVISSSPLITGNIAQMAMASSTLKVVLHMATGQHKIPVQEFPLGRVLTQILNASAYIRDAPAVGYSKKDEVIKALDEMIKKVYAPFEEQFQRSKTTRDVLDTLRTEEFITMMTRRVKHVVDQVDFYVETLSRDWKDKNLPRLKDFITEIETCEKKQRKDMKRTKQRRHNDEEEFDFF